MENVGLKNSKFEARNPKRIRMSKIQNKKATEKIEKKAKMQNGRKF